MVSEGLRRSGVDLQVLFSSTYPIKLSLFCLGSTARAVIVGSVGLAADSCDRAKNGTMTARSRPDILAIMKLAKRS